MKELGKRKANEHLLTDEHRVKVSQLLDIAKAEKNLAESKRVSSLDASYTPWCDVCLLSITIIKKIQCHVFD